VNPHLHRRRRNPQFHRNILKHSTRWIYSSWDASPVSLLVLI